MIVKMVCPDCEADGYEAMACPDCKVLGLRSANCTVCDGHGHVPAYLADPAVMGEDLARVWGWTE